MVRAGDMRQAASLVVPESINLNAEYARFNGSVENMRHFQFFHDFLKELSVTPVLRDEHNFHFFFFHAQLYDEADAVYVCQFFTNHHQIWFQFRDELHGFMAGSFLFHDKIACLEQRHN